MTPPIQTPSLRQAAITPVARGAAEQSQDPQALIEAASQMGVPNMGRLAQSLARVAQADPAQAAQLLADLKPRLSPQDQQRLAQDLAEELPASLPAAAPTAHSGTSNNAGSDPDLAARKRELALDLAQIGLSLAGIIDPTPISDGIDGVISVFRGDWLGAGISVVSMVPYLGDAAKLGKLGAFARTIESAVDLAKLDPAFARTIAPALDKIKGALDAVPLDSLPKPARDAIESMKGKLDEMAQAGTREIATRVGRNDVAWTVDADGRTVAAHADLRELFDGAKRTSAERDAQRAQAALGEADDVGGHIIGHRFIKANGEKNIFPQNTQFNNSAYRTMENEWADWIRSGHEVSIDVRLIGDGARPERVEVFYRVVDPASGKTVFKNSADFANQAGQVFERVPRGEMQ